MRCGIAWLLGLLTLAVLVPVALAAPAQLAGREGCVDYLGRDSCAAGRALGGARAVVASPDGRFVYAGARAVAVFARSSSGELSQLPGTGGCLSADTRDRQVGPRGSCARVRGVLHADSLTMSADGRTLYAVDLRQGTIAVLPRDVGSGRVRQPAGRAGCANASGADGCARDPRLGGLRMISLAADGRDLYAVAGDARIVVLRRTATGALSALRGRGACLAFHARLGCTRVERLQGAFKVIPSASGHAVYVITNYGDVVEDASQGAVITLSRSPSGRIALRHGSSTCLASVGRGCRRLPDGLLVDLAQDPSGHTLWLSGGPTYKGSFTSTSTRAVTVASGGSLTLGARTVGASDLVFSADGHEAFGLGLDDGTVRVFSRNPAAGSLTPASPNCIAEASPGFATPCVSAHGTASPQSLAVSPDSQNLYVASPGSDGLSAFVVVGP